MGEQNHVLHLLGIRPRLVKETHNTELPVKQVQDERITQLGRNLMPHHPRKGSYPLVEWSYTESWPTSQLNAARIPTSPEGQLLEELHCPRCPQCEPRVGQQAQLLLCGAWLRV
jgi:hypothetical protein